MTAGREPWHLDRRIPVATLVMLALQAIGFTSWITWQTAALSSRLEALEKSQAASLAAASALRVEARLSIVETQMGMALRSLERLENRFDTRPAYPSHDGPADR